MSIIIAITVDKAPKTIASRNGFIENENIALAARPIIFLNVYFVSQTHVYLDYTLSQFEETLSKQHTSEKTIIFRHIH